MAAVIDHDAAEAGEVFADCAREDDAGGFWPIEVGDADHCAGDVGAVFGEDAFDGLGVDAEFLQGVGGGLEAPLAGGGADVAVDHVEDGALGPGTVGGFAAAETVEDFGDGVAAAAGDAEHDGEHVAFLGAVEGVGRLDIHWGRLDLAYEVFEVFSVVEGFEIIVVAHVAGVPEAGCDGGGECGHGFVGFVVLGEAAGEIVLKLVGFGVVFDEVFQDAGGLGPFFLLDEGEGDAGLLAVGVVEAFALGGHDAAGVVVGGEIEVVDVFGEGLFVEVGEAVEGGDGGDDLGKFFVVDVFVDLDGIGDVGGVGDAIDLIG